ncbi:hypothetical protein WBG06_24690 [Nocardioides sp. CCNWLW239]|uniref:hypothetical protein n=1 Tax=Nocardioides sp. CCNWLW239 TaxID=3128902 RepID=UPI00301620D0
MSDYIIDASIDHETNKVYSVRISTQDGQYVSRWEEPYPGPTVADLGDKDEVRRIVNVIRATRFR